MQTFNVLIQKKLVPTIQKSLKKHPEKHPSLEHSLMVLLEEVHELKMEVFRDHDKRNLERIAQEALQVSHCALRLVHDNIEEDTYVM